MNQVLQQTYKILEKAVLECNAKSISLSGGLDSAIIAYFLQDKGVSAISVISKDFIANDLTYCQLAAKRFKMPLSIKMCQIDQIYHAIEQTVEILGNFNDIEIRNNVVAYIAFDEAKNRGFDRIVTGDGADEIFAGYNFLLNKTESELQVELDRIRKIMHFPSQKIGKALGITVESPFCSTNVLKFAKTIPANMLVGERDGKKYGKLILRKAFEDKIPKSIVWRAKSPMQEGAGTQGLTEFFEHSIPDYVFAQRVRQIKEKDNVTIRTKESLQYYEIFRKNHDPPSSIGVPKCPDCNAGIESRFCRMCGKFPV
ncbi:asparagine synthase C-terminal domain-containing protein [Candidatus Nitrosotenuis uzonensis]|uniref:Asparagine synthase n=1 Tax=Candidatus Nitrosotenuis uzonensis TaxID=1407055 RepID=A0A812F0H9_9ARCH|nr:asparagine synthase C-terminal domain-containing protein [Candidatus Nitrosotenuis uzonensis]MCA2003218.1 asparagine synthase C-terminal domain-containing protein [Candidatus Nitrosotenuis sp.]CAE6498641.1 Asparagine synthase [Candidatus Nitrosotenuis uzonensis]